MRRAYSVLTVLPVMLALALCATLAVSSLAQDRAPADSGHAAAGVEPQPFIAQVVRLEEALSFLGSRLLPADARAIQALVDQAPTPELVERIQQVLDPYCLAMVDINPEARVKVIRGPAKAELVQGGWKSFLVKVNNDAHINAELQVESPNALPLLHKSTGAKRVQEKNVLSPGQVANRFLEVEMYRNRPLHANLSGLKLEYAILQIHTNETGKREAKIGFHVGQGTQDIGFRNTVDILFDCQPSVRVVFRIQDDDGSPVMAGFIISDGLDRMESDPDKKPFPMDYRHFAARRDPWDLTRGIGWAPATKRLVGIYPLPARRIADGELPDFYFQPQIYRTEGESVQLPPGEYVVEYTRGPHYLNQQKTLIVPEAKEEIEVSFQLQRWVDPASLGWYSADHHVHGGGCSHYESPTEGVRPEGMWRQALGEDLDIACVLTWGPCWYHQKTFFEGETHPLSTKRNLMRYDVEVSGFPSSHAGHIVLLRLTEDDYPGTKLVEEWPSWTLPILSWAKSQGGATGYAHSGWGLEPVRPTNDLPFYVLSKFDGIGANEYVVTVTHDAVDFYSAGDTPWNWELNTWYHSLNAGFRVRLSGETDFPCIYDERVGMARTYAKVEGELDFHSYVDKIKEGHSYVSDGLSHIIDFTVNEQKLGVNKSELHLKGAQEVQVMGRVSAYLPREQSEVGARIASRELFQPPYWDLERARIGKSRRVAVDLIVNGIAVDSQEIVANGNWVDLAFDHAIDRSSWVALRIHASSHTNPIFVLVDGKPVLPSRRSVEWSRAAVDKCWENKLPRIRESEQAAAKAAYDHARAVYDRLIAEAMPD